MHKSADIYSQTFEVQDPQYPELSGLKVHFESFVEGDALQEQMLIDEMPAKKNQTWETFFFNYYEPEFAASSLLITIYADFEKSILGSYRNGIWFGVKAQQQEGNAQLVFAHCGEKQSKSSALNELASIFQGIPPTSKKIIAHGNCDGFALWRFDPKLPLFLCYQYAGKKETLEEQRSISFALAKQQVLEKDTSWLTKQKSAPQFCPEAIKNLYSRSLLTVKQMQDPSGGIIAAPEFQFEFTHCGGYGYCWGRDAGFITFAMDVCGMHKESAHFYEYMMKCQNNDGSFFHRHDMDAHLGSSWGFLQPDETGSVIFGLWQHIHLSQNKEIAYKLKNHITKAIDWLCTAKFKPDSLLPIPGIDLWEERDGIHLYSVAAMVAGIESGLKIYQFMGWEQEILPLWEKRTIELKELINSEPFVSKNEGNKYTFSRILQYKIDPQRRVDTEHTLDISMIGILYPYDVLDPNIKKECALHLTRQLMDALWVEPNGGIKRYEDDQYRKGSPWILTTLWLALAAYRLGEREIGKKCFTWALEHVTPEGFFAEQIDPKTGQPCWVVPLTWSHAMFLLCIQEFPEDF
ncbi:MAG: hypothetical protein K2X39_07025, partial [Silvanigrellaceae bacterium]|nr:hypothetical protein [Silvanigrellaceae bacterium]